MYIELIDKGMDFACFNVGEAGNGLYVWGIPSDLEPSLARPVSRKAVSGRL